MWPLLCCAVLCCAATSPTSRLNIFPYKSHPGHKKRSMWPEMTKVLTETLALSHHWPSLRIGGMAKDIGTVMIPSSHPSTCVDGSSRGGGRPTISPSKKKNPLGEQRCLVAQLGLIRGDPGFNCSVASNHWAHNKIPHVSYPPCRSEEESHAAEGQNWLCERLALRGDLRKVVARGNSRGNRPWFFFYLAQPTNMQ